MDFASRANKQPIEPSVMMEVVRSLPTLATAAEDNDGKMAAIVRAVAKQDLNDEDRSMTAVSISFRLEALVRLIEDSGDKGWISPEITDGHAVREDVIRCAAMEPLIKKDGRAAFDPESFHRRLAG